MPKRIFINNLDTYVSQAIFSELRNDTVDEEGNMPEDVNVIFGSYINKDSSNYPKGVTKMLKRSKPRLAMKYLSTCDVIVYDLHSGDPLDVKLALEALTPKVKGEEDEDAAGGEEKTLILISSLLAWDGTDRKLEEVRDPLEIDAEKKAMAARYKARQEAERERIISERRAARKIKTPAPVPAEGEGEEAAVEGEEKAAEDAEVAEVMSGQESDKEEDLETELKQIPLPTVEEEQPPFRRHKKYLHYAFDENDFAKRQCSEEYNAIKEAEDLVLNFKAANVKCYVISAGVLYGKGEAIFNSHFKQAWLQEPARLPLVGEGNNFVPTIHVTDLARMVKKVSESKPERPYIFGIDNTKKPTQKKLIRAISKGIGTGLISETDIPVEFVNAHPQKTPLQLDLDWRKFLLLNIKAKPSSLFVAPEQPAGDADPDDPPQDDGTEFNWHCKQGLAANIQLVKKEFCQHRGLKPFKTTIIGKPCSGKSFFGGKLADHYNVPHILTDRVLNDIEHWQDEQEKVFRVLEDKRKKAKQADEAKYAEYLKTREDDKAKVEADRLNKKAAKKQAQGEDYESSGGEAAPDVKSPPPEEDPVVVDDEPKAEEPKDDDEAVVNAEPETIEARQAKYKKQQALLQVEAVQSEEEFEELTIKVKIRNERVETEQTRISTNLLCEAFRWRLSQNDCQNRGYILDSFPFSYATADQIFVIRPEAPKPKEPELDEDGNQIPVDDMPEDDLLELMKPKFQKEIYPDSVIFIRGYDDFLRQRAEKICDADANKTKWNKEDMERRLNKFNEVNNLQLFVQSNTHKDLGLPSYKPGVLPISRFYQENKTEVFEVECDGDVFEMFESMRVYIERSGRSYNYLRSVKNLNEEREGHLEQEEKDCLKDKAKCEEDDKKISSDKRAALEALAMARIADLEKHVGELDKSNKLYMRQFLMKAIIPVLTEGMIDVWRVGPTDPVDYLAEYIFKKSNELAK